MRTARIRPCTTIASTAFAIQPSPSTNRVKARQAYLAIAKQKRPVDQPLDRRGTDEPARPARAAEERVVPVTPEEPVGAVVAFDQVIAA